MKAILSDIHGNLEALQAVMEDIRSQPVDGIYCLGDVAGYGGPNPRECVDLTMQWRVVLCGNHDQAIFLDPEGYGECAYKAIRWATAQLQMPTPDNVAADRRWEFLRERPRSYKESDLLFVHGSPRNPLYEYIFPEHAKDEERMAENFSLVEHYCFVGHTHIPGVFTDNRHYHTPEELDYAVRLGKLKTLVNVGSVGQPRDGDWRACFVLFDGTTVRFRRVEYDVETTVRKIRDIDGLDDFLGARLRDGR